jgi:hypothetical protein
MPKRRTSENPQNANFAVTELSEVPHRPGFMPQSFLCRTSGSVSRWQMRRSITHATLLP